MVGRWMVRPLQGRICFAVAFRGLAPTAIHVHPLRGWGMARCDYEGQLALQIAGGQKIRAVRGFLRGSPEASNMNSRGCNPRKTSEIITGPERAEQRNGRLMMRPADAERVFGRWMVRPLQGRILYLTVYRGLAPTAIHVHPLRGWGREHAPRRAQLELLQPAEKFGGEEAVCHAIRVCVPLIQNCISVSPQSCRRNKDLRWGTQVSISNLARRGLLRLECHWLIFHSP